MKFRKKPIEIEAVNWNGVALQLSDLQQWVREAISKDPHEPGCIFRLNDELHIFTLEGMVVAKPGDWVIQGVKGEIYPCKPDIFEATYERV